MRTTSARTKATASGQRVLILSAGVGSGHNSAAAAVQQACAARADIAEVQVLDVLQVRTVFSGRVWGEGLFGLVEDLPGVVGGGYDISNPPFRRRGPIDPWTRVNASP